jgi:glycosyltransferase involved in cell wall biosynthesis
LVVAPPHAPLLERAREAGLPARALRLRGEVDPAGTWRLARLLQELRPDILHLHDGHAVLPGQLAARVLPAASVSVVAHRRTAFAVRGRWKFGGRVDKVIAISQAVRAQLLAAGLPEERVAVVYSGLEFPEPLPHQGSTATTLRRELGIPPEALVIAHAGALTAEKRQADLLQALHGLGAGPEAQPSAKGGRSPDVHLVIAGSGELEHALRAAGRRPGLAGRVHFLGFRRDLRALWAAADWVAYASEMEGLCTALIEAQGAGLPAVVTRAGGMTEVVAEGVTGLMVPVGAVADLAAAFRQLASDAALRERLGRAARVRARRLFAAEAMVASTLRIYRELRRGGRSSAKVCVAGVPPA